MSNNDCPLCLTDGGTLVWQNKKLRVIHTPEPGFPAFFRVVWNQHVAELSDLDQSDMHYCLDVVTQVERVLREVLSPDKINLASLGNMVPHLHWHIIARFKWDSHFPNAIWAPAEREIDTIKINLLENGLVLIKQKLLASL